MQMTREIIFEKLKDIMLSIDPSRAKEYESVTESTRLVEDLGFTSIAVLYIVVAIEETFSINFGDLGVEDFKTIGEVIGYIDEQVNK